MKDQSSDERHEIKVNKKTLLLIIGALTVCLLATTSLVGTLIFLLTQK